jgi:hypothetical protein
MPSVGTVARTVSTLPAVIGDVAFTTNATSLRVPMASFKNFEALFPDHCPTGVYPPVSLKILRAYASPAARNTSPRSISIAHRACLLCNQSRI